MAFPPSAARTVLVWLLTVMSLVANATRFDCVCPNGDHRLCFVWLSPRGAGCCCGGVCCAHPTAADRSDPANTGRDTGSSWEGTRPRKSCCACARHAPAGQSDPAGRLSSPCCKKTPAEAQVLFKPSGTVIGAEQLADWFSTPLAQSNPFGLLPPSRVRPDSLLRYDLPPPPDLVVVLRHFTI